MDAESTTQEIMPELPEVETVRLGLAPVVEGRTIRRARAMRPDLRFPLPEGFVRRLTGAGVHALERRAKYLLWRLDGGETLLSHLGMSGRVRIFKGDVPPLEKHDHVVFIVGGAEVRFNDPRRFGFMDLIAPGAVATHPMLRDLGPEPLSDAFSVVQLTEALKGRRTSIKAALLDQKIVAGLGNIYVCEALFRSRINPETPAGRVAKPGLARLVSAVRDVLTRAIAAGGSSLRDHRRPDGEIGYFQHAFQVYGREGEPCPNKGCGDAVRRMTQGGRSTFYCETCQS